jgi:hypothetical protein
MQSFRQSKAIAILVALFWVLWLLLFNSATPAWDAVFYYAYARSVVFDHDLHLENDLAYSYPTTAPDFAAKRFDAVRTITGRVASPFPVGSSLLWIPWLAVLRCVAEGGRLLGIGSEVWTGYEWLFISGLSALSALNGWLALWVAYRVARSEVGKATALVAAVTVVFSAPLLYYQFREPLYSHTLSALATGACVYVWWRGHRSSPQLDHAILLGGLVGLATLVRWQHAMYLFLPLVSTIWWWLFAEERRREEWKQAVVYLGGVGGAALVVFSIQLVTWKVLFDDWIIMPQGRSFMDWTAPFVLPTLFSTYRGLLPWMPVTLFSVLGLFALGKRQPRLAVPLLTVLALELYVNASVRDWFGGGGLGPRRFISELPIILIGYAGFLQALSGRVRVIAGYALGFGLSIQQWILLRYGLLERIGGRNLSGAPDYLWEEAGYRAFFQQLAAHLPDAVRHPLDFFIFPGAPLDGLMAPRMIQYALVLLATVVFVALSLKVGKLIAEKTLRPAARRGLMVIAMVLIAAIDLWILVWA